MTWDELDLEQKLWTIPASRMKAKRAHRVPLSTAAVTLLQSMLPSSGKVELGQLVFSGAKKDTQLSDMTLAAVLRRMQVAVTTHGFRSSFRDWAGEATHHPREVIEHALAHQLKGAGGGYGFPQVTAAARAVELAIREKRLDDAHTAAQALVALCTRVTS